jgi:hypothetical protein
MYSETRKYKLEKDYNELCISNYDDSKICKFILKDKHKNLIYGWVDERFYFSYNGKVKIYKIKEDNEEINVVQTEKFDLNFSKNPRKFLKTDKLIFRKDNENNIIIIERYYQNRLNIFYGVTLYCIQRFQNKIIKYILSFTEGNYDFVVFKPDYNGFVFQIQKLNKIKSYNIDFTNFKIT